MSRVAGWIMGLLSAAVVVLVLGPVQWSSMFRIPTTELIENMSITYHELTHEEADNPEFELTIDRLEPGAIATFRCISACAAPGTVGVEVAEERLVRIREAIGRSRFFLEPRFDPKRGHNWDTLTVRTNRGIHEVVGAWRVAEFTKAVRESVDVAFLTTPSVKLYEYRLRGRWRVNSRDQRGTALTTAVWHCDLTSVNFLLAHGAVPDHDSVWPLDNCSNDLVDRLVPVMAVTAQEMDDLLHRAASSQNVRVLRALLRRKAMDGQSFTPDHLNQALLEAADGDPADAIRVLLGAGAAVNAADRMGRTPLMAAAGMCRSDNVEVLLQAGADTRLRDADGKRALDHVEEDVFGAEPCARVKTLLR